MLKYPEVIYKDACVIADILSSYDPSEILSFTKPIGEQKKISIQNINKYYTYLDASVDYVLSIEIIVKDCLITQYSYTYKPNMSDVIKLEHFLFADVIGHHTARRAFCGELREIIVG